MAGFLRSGHIWVYANGFRPEECSTKFSTLHGPSSSRSSFHLRLIDDILIASSTPEGHLQHLRIIFECLQAHEIVVKPNKVSCCPQLSSTSIPTSPTSFHWPRQLLTSLFSYCVQLMQPLHSLLSSSKSMSQTLTWTDSAIAAFNVTKDACSRKCFSPVLPSTRCPQLPHDRCLQHHSWSCTTITR